MTSAAIAGERASGESPHLFHQHHAQQEGQRWPPGGADRRTHDASRSCVWSRPGQTQGEDERDQRGVRSDSLQPAVLRGQMTAGRGGHSPAILFLLVYRFVACVSYFAITKLAVQTKRRV